MNQEKILAIDYGNARTGLAITNQISSHSKIALPLKTVAASGDKLFQELQKVIEQYRVSHIVVGLPLLLSGKDSKQTLQTREFIEKLQERFAFVKVISFDERLTSRQAEKLLVERKMNRKQRAAACDETSAWILLCCYLETLPAQNP